jgi:hypothetical protein
VAGDIEIYRGTVNYRSIGSESDALVAAMHRVYEVSPTRASMKDAVTFEAARLEGRPADLGREPVKIKLFFEEEGEDSYAEVYTNLNLPGQKLEIREKDTGYRVPLLHALARE